MFPSETRTCIVDSASFCLNRMYDRPDRKGLFHRDEVYK